MFGKSSLSFATTVDWLAGEELPPDPNSCTKVTATHITAPHSKRRKHLYRAAAAVFLVVNNTRPASMDITRPCHKECSSVRQRAGAASFRNQGLIVGIVRD